MRLLFYISKLYSLPVIEPLLKEIEIRNNDTKISLFVSLKVKRKLSSYFLKFTIYTNIREAQKFNSDFVLCPGNFVDFRLPGIKIELFHGIGVEKPSHFKIRHFFDAYFTSGPYVTTKFKKMQRKYKYFTVLETGWPKIDYIVNFDTKNLRKALDIPNNKKVVLYAPTHSKLMESATDLIPVFKNTIKDDEFWICKPHEFMKKGLVAGMKNMGIRVLSTFDITPYLHVADVMISDTSSVIYEFMLLDKPVITYRTFGRKDKGIDINKPNQLRSALERSFQNPQEYSKHRLKHIQEVNPVIDGTISKSVINQLELWHSESFKIHRKPLNLFRKMQIIYHSKHKKGYLR